MAPININPARIKSPIPQPRRAYAPERSNGKNCVKIALLQI
jgi:hypothetical protein